MHKLAVLFLIIFVFTSCQSKRKDDNSLILFAAASVTNVVYEIAENFQSKTGIQVKINIASSGVLARQIVSGAPFDYFISANKNWMQYVDSAQFVDSNSIRILASNSLVAIVPNNDTKSYNTGTFTKLLPNLFQGRLSVGDPVHVPAGKYARQTMQFYGIDKLLKDRYLPAKNARDALLMVEMREAEMGIVYKTDASGSDKVRVVYEFPEKTCEPIHYLGAAGKNRPKALNKFEVYLQSEAAKMVWKKNRFKLKEYE